MSDQRHALDPAKAGTMATVIHGAVTAGVVIVLAVFLYLRTRVTFDFSSESGRILRFVGYALLAVGVVGSGILRGRITPRRSGDDRADWWVANLPKAVPAWALAEGGGLAAMVLGWVTGDTTLLALGAAGSLAMLFVSRPSRLQSRT